MDTVEVVGLGFTTSAVGLGCAGLGGRLSARESFAVLDAATEAGVRHFDVARSYGYGGAEIAVGSFLAARGRDNFTVTTKAGIRPPRRLAQLAPVRNAARRIAAVHPALRARLSRAAQSGVAQGRFALPEIRGSVEASLKALLTDHVDLLLLHECTSEDVNDELREWLDGRVQAGAARAWGIATTAAQAELILERTSVDVVQLPAPVGEPLPRAMTMPGPVIRVRHSVLRDDSTRLRFYLSDPARRRIWEDRLGSSLRPTDVALLLLRLARAADPAGMVLLGTQSADHARSLRDLGQVPEPEMAAGIRSLVAEARAATP